jgi:MFS family permease
MSSSYRALFARTGARAVALSCGLGWWSFASYGLAIVLAVEAATGSFPVAGGAVAAFSAGSALLAPLRGRFVDRRGPRALAYFAPLHAAALLLLVVGCASSHSSWVLVGSAGLAGTFTPPLIATARAVWSQVSGPDLARTSHSVNAALGDAAQVIGPAFTGAVAAVASPLVALGLLVPGATAGAVILAVSAPPRVPATPRPSAHRVWGVLDESVGLRTIVVCELAMGLWVGALEVAAPATAAEHGAAELGAVPLAVFAAASVAVSLWSGTGRLQRTAASRYLAGSIAVAVVLPLCLLVPSLVGITAVVVVAGAGFGLLNVALFELLDDVVPSDRAVEAFTWLTTWQGVGLAAGAAGAGQLSRGGASGTLVLVALPAALAAAVAVANRPALRHAGGPAC